MASQTKNISKILWGIVYTILGVGIYLWISQHSPHMNFTEMMTNSDTYLIKEPIYTIIILVAILFAVNGVVLIIRGIIAESKNTKEVNSQLKQTQSGNTADIIVQLEKLASLKEKGILSQTEFEGQKSKLLENKK